MTIVKIDITPWKLSIGRSFILITTGSVKPDASMVVAMIGPLTTSASDMRRFERNRKSSGYAIKPTLVLVLVISVYS